MRQSVKWRAYDADVIPAWVAEMDFTLAAPIAKVLSEAISRSDTGYAWTSDLGVALSSFAQQRWQWSIDPDCVIPVADVLTGVGHVLLALTQPGDSVVITSPVYPPFFTTVTTVAHCEVVDSIEKQCVKRLAALKSQLFWLAVHITPQVEFSIAMR